MLSTDVWETPITNATKDRGVMLTACASGYAAEILRFIPLDININKVVIRLL